ncbi:MAG TPA: hypothetical protein VKS22_10150 [Candidatus Binataceae bacterium]|nr:hypothetical protein [Candidatus Binataceae bacterium]
MFHAKHFVSAWSVKHVRNARRMNLQERDNGAESVLTLKQMFRVKHLVNIFMRAKGVSEGFHP